MKKINLLLLVFVMAGCIFNMGGGTHGSIKGYEYPVTKAELAGVINKIIQSDTSLRQDFRADYYNDTKNYITLNIKSHANEVEYIFRYFGDSSYWAHSSSSEIFICYVYDHKGNGGSEGNGKWDKTDSKIQDSLVNLFETKFVSRINSELNQKAIIRP